MNIEYDDFRFFFTPRKSGTFAKINNLKKSSSEYIFIYFDLNSLAMAVNIVPRHIKFQFIFDDDRR